MKCFPGELQWPSGELVGTAPPSGVPSRQRCVCGCQTPQPSLAVIDLLQTLSFPKWAMTDDRNGCRGLVGKSLCLVSISRMSTLQWGRLFNCFPCRSKILWGWGSTRSLLYHQFLTHGLFSDIPAQLLTSCVTSVFLPRKWEFKSPPEGVTVTACSLGFCLIWFLEQPSRGADVLFCVASFIPDLLLLLFFFFKSISVIMGKSLITVMCSNWETLALNFYEPMFT